MLLLLSGCLLLLAEALCGQSLAQLRAELQTNNLELQALQYEYQAVLERPAQVGQLPDPEVGIGGFPLPVETRLGPQQLRISATQMIPWPGRLKQEQDVVRAEALLYWERWRARELELRFDLEMAYYELWEVAEQQRILTQQLALLQSQEQLALAEVESGRGTSIAVLRIDLQKQQLIEQLDLLAFQRIAPESCLRELLAWPADRFLTLPTTGPFPVLVLNRDSINAQIQSEHPDLRYWQAQTAVSQERVHLNTFAAKPSFGVGVDYIAVGQRDNAVISNNGRDVVQLKASIRLPIQQQRYRAKEQE
ncbi:MAG: TolC family protein, partial [Bacteroidota bacterium]